MKYIQMQPLILSIYENSSLTERVLLFEGINDNEYVEGPNACLSRET